jgi:hypothetical protein
MATKYTLGYLQYIKEAEEAELNAPLKGYPAAQLITRIEELMEVLSDQVRFGVPSDNLGRATTYRDANGAIQRIKDILHYYDSKSEQVRFYCWSLSYGGTWKAAKNLRKNIEDAGGFGEELNNVNLKKVIEYFTNNPEDSDNLRSISISIDSESIRKAMNAPKPDEKPGADQPAKAQVSAPKPSPSSTESEI